MLTGNNRTYYGDHFTIYTNIKSLCCTPETNITLYINYTLPKKKGCSYAHWLCQET